MRRRVQACGRLVPLLLLLAPALAPPRASAAATGQTARPEDVGLSTARLARLDALIENYVDQDRLAGVVTLVARRGKVAQLRAYGQMDVEGGRQMRRDAIFRIHSMTKPVTSVAVLTLLEEGRFQLYDPASRFLPELAEVQVLRRVTDAGIEVEELDRPITIHDLLTHTAGLSYGLRSSSRGGGLPVDDLYREAKVLEGGTLAEMMGTLARLPLAFQPGDRWHYSVATDVLGRLVEVVSGMPLDRYFDERIFQPLAMVDTGFQVPAHAVPRLTSVYGPADGGGLRLLEAPASSPYTRRPTLLSGGGGLVSTAADYHRFASMLLSGGALDGTRVLGRKTVELMTTNHILGEFSPGYGYGLGVSVVENVPRTRVMGTAGAFGWYGAATTTFFVDPEEDLVAIFLTQLEPYAHYPVLAEFKNLVYQAIID